MLICSDGHVFGDLIGVSDEHIDAYGDELHTIIQREGLDRLGIFDLREVFGNLPYDEKRAWVSERYAPTIEQLRAEVRTNAETLSLYCGITRFLVNDSAAFTGNKLALQRECRRRAYGVIQRSRAWSDLIAAHYPRSVRLSIHPQRRNAAKFGIGLLDTADPWTTPWHSSVLYRGDDSWELMRRDEAERLGQLVIRDGRPSHFEAR
jgi:pyoverdine/dityrosine biosynthesis protein Dit1